MLMNLVAGNNPTLQITSLIIHGFGGLFRWVWDMEEEKERRLKKNADCITTEEQWQFKKCIISNSCDIPHPPKKQ